MRLHDVARQTVYDNHFALLVIVSPILHVYIGILQGLWGDGPSSGRHG